jgi:phage gp36-like protein
LARGPDRFEVFMTYATQADLVTRFGEVEIIQLSDDANAGAIDAAVVAIVLADVDRAIDGYLLTRYTLPLTEVPDILNSIACDLAHYRLATRNGGSRASDTLKDRNSDAMRQLRDIASGKFTLGLTQTGAKVASSETTRSAPADRQFTRDALRDFNPLHGHHRRRREW